MPQHYTLEFKKHHIEAWRTRGRTRRQYCESQGINEGTSRTFLDVVCGWKVN